MLPLLNHVYHSKLQEVEIQEIMSDVVLLKLDDRISQAIFHFFCFVSKTMFGVNGTRCITSFTYENDVLIGQFAISSPLNDKTFLLAQICQNANQGFNSMQKEFAELKYTNVFKTVSPLTTTVLNSLPYESVRTELFNFMDLLSEAVSEDEEKQNYLHLNDARQGYMKVGRFFPEIESSKSFNVTLQILLKPEIDDEYSTELLEEARGAVVS